MMMVTVKLHDPDPVQQLLEMTSIYHPYINVGKLNKNEKKRLFRKLIRQRDFVLQTIHSLVTFQCPIFVYHDMCQSFRDFRFSDFRFESDELSFEMIDGIDDAQINQVTCLFKKVKIVIKNLLSVGSLEKDICLRHCLPMSTIVEYNIYLDFLETFRMMSCLEDKILPQTKQILTEMYNILTEQCPDIFTKQNLDIYIASREK
jgi:hypothetical protein